MGYKLNIVEQKYQLEMLCNEIAKYSKKPVFMLGDFNLDYKKLNDKTNTI